MKTRLFLLVIALVLLVGGPAAAQAVKYVESTQPAMVVDAARTS